MLHSVWICTWRIAATQKLGFAVRARTGVLMLVVFFIEHAQYSEASNRVVMLRSRSVITYNFSPFKMYALRMRVPSKMLC